MNHGIKPFRLAAVFCSSMLFATILLFSGSCDSDLPLVDMHDYSKNAGALIPDDPRPTLRIAIGSMISPEITRDYYNELMRLIATRMGMRPVFLQRRTYREVNEMVKNKEADIAFVCSGPYTNGHDEFGMELLVVPVAHGKKTYQSYILVHRDSTLTSFDDLQGKKFAFTDPQSNSGCLVPIYMLAQKGETPESFFQETFYSHSHDNSIQAVADKQADGAAVDSLIWEFINTISPALTSRTKIIEKSRAFGIPPVVVHPDMNDDEKKRLRDLFLTLHEDEEASALLAKIHVDQFAEGEDSMYDTVREMSRWVEKMRRK